MYKKGRISNCIRCGGEFVVGNTDSQQHCSVECIDWEEEWEEQQKGSRSEKLTTENEKGKNMQTQNGDRNISKIKEKIANLSQSGSDSDQENIIGKEEKPSLRDSLNTLNRTENEFESVEEFGQEKTENTSPSYSEKKEEGTIQLQDSQSLSENLKLDVLSSLNILTDLSKQLLTSMKRVTENDSNTVRLFDPERVRAQAECGRQVVSAMRAKLDIFKFGKDVVQMERDYAEKDKEPKEVRT